VRVAQDLGTPEDGDVGRATGQGAVGKPARARNGKTADGWQPAAKAR
jgi:hypothetical protein